MVSLKLQKRLSASVLQCGRGKVWIDPNEVNEISVANSRQNIIKLAKDGFIIKKPTKIHSQSRARRMKEAKRNGRHLDMVNVRVRYNHTREARHPTKIIWMRRPDACALALAPQVQGVERKLTNTCTMICK